MATIINRFENNFIVPDFSSAEYNPGTGYYTNVDFPYENKDILKEVYDYYHDGIESISLFHCVATDGAFLGDITINREVNIKKADERMLELWFSFAGIDYIIKADISDVFSVEGSTYRRYYNENKGVIYYSLESPYEGDVTKKCGLTSDDLDNNVYFLRGNDVASISFDEEEGSIKLIKLNGDVMKTEPMDEYISSEVQKDVEGVVDEIMCEISGVSETLTELIEDEKNERIDADTAINESITDLYGKKVDKEEFDSFVTVLNEELTDKFDGIDNDLQQEQTKRTNADNELFRQIDETCMRVYRERNGGYNMNNCLWYGHYFGCNLGRPSASTEGETYALTTLNTGTATVNDGTVPNDFSQLIDNNPGTGWNGCHGTYNIEGVSFPERYFGSYPLVHEEVCKMIIGNLPNGKYMVDVLTAASSTKDRDAYLPEPDTESVAVSLTLNGIPMNPSKDPHSEKRISIESFDELIRFSGVVTITGGTIDIRLFAGEKNTANWFVVRTVDLIAVEMNEPYLAIKQVCQSNKDNGGVFQRMVYTKDRNKFIFPTTVYGEWEQADKAEVDLTNYYTSAQTDILLAHKQPVGNYVSASTLNDYYTSEQTTNLVESAATIINQTIEDNEYTISVALNDLNERTELNALDIDNLSTLVYNKQDKLTAGTGIAIDSNNVISASGGGVTEIEVTMPIVFGTYNESTGAYDNTYLKEDSSGGASWLYDIAPHIHQEMWGGSSEKSTFRMSIDITQGATNVYGSVLAYITPAGSHELKVSFSFEGVDYTVLFDVSANHATTTAYKLSHLVANEENKFYDTGLYLEELMLMPTISTSTQEKLSALRMSNAYDKMLLVRGYHSVQGAGTYAVATVKYWGSTFEFYVDDNGTTVNVQGDSQNKWTITRTTSEMTSNKKTTITGNESSNEYFPTTKAVADYVGVVIEDTRTTIENNELTISSALNELNSRINEIDAKIAALNAAIEEIRGGN